MKLPNVGLIFFFTLVSFFIRAQVSVLFKPFIHAGLTFSQIHGDTFEGYNKIGFTGGINVSYPFSKKHFGTIGLGFVQKGALKASDANNNDFTYYSITLNYIEVPISTGYQFKCLNFHVSLAPAVLIDYTEEQANLPFAYSNPINTFDCSLKLGIGYTISENFGVLFNTTNSFMCARKTSFPTTIIYNNFLANYFNNGFYNNILECNILYHF